MARKRGNTVVNMINEKIAKKQRIIAYYENKASEPTFKRDGIVFTNDEEWQSYWLSIASAIEEEIDELYVLLKIVHSERIGEVEYLQPPLTKTVHPSTFDQEET
jgi:hypothetical protein